MQKIDKIPRTEECEGDQLYMNCAFNLNSCDEKVADAECSQGCGCPYDKPYYNTEDMQCQSLYDFCPVSLCVLRLNMKEVLTTLRLVHGCLG